MSARRIALSFEHTTCAVLIDITLPLPDPIVEAAETMADRVRPTCPICKNPTDYTGFCFDAATDHPGRDEKLKEALEEALGGWSGAIGGFPWSPDSEKRDRARIAELEKLL